MVEHYSFLQLVARAMCFDAYRKVVGLLVYNDSQIPKCQTAQINLGTPLDIFKMLYYKFV